MLFIVVNPNIMCIFTYIKTTIMNIIQDDKFNSTLLPNEMGIYKKTVNGKLVEVRLCQLYNYDSRSQEYVIRLDHKDSQKFKTFTGRGNYPIKETSFAGDHEMEFVSIFKT